jgi:cytochrome c oxidase subunit 2
MMLPLDAFRAIGFTEVLLAQSGGSFWLPPPESTTAGAVDWLFYFILWISVFFFALIVALMVAFVIRYRRRPGVEPGQSRSHNLLLEATWSIIPLILVMVIFFFGFEGYMKMRAVPAGSYEIGVVARKWSWSFEYPDGTVVPDLHVPVDRAVRLRMRSEDVIHSLFIPAFRVKMDVVPGRYNTTWFEAKTPGDYTLFCAEYCGDQHSGMLATVVVHEPGDFEAWLEGKATEFEGLTPPEKGRETIRRKGGCLSCHSVDGTAKQGPSFQGLFGTERKFTNAPAQVADENYIRESILEPNAKIRAGYEGVIMNSYKGLLTDEEIDWIIEYIKTLK